MKVCVVTGTRAESGLLYWLMKEIDNDESLQLQTIVTGMHLSPEFGLTYKAVEKEFKIDKKIEILLSSDTSTGVIKSMGLAQISFAEVLEDLSPDIVIILGDRFEMLSVASAALIHKIPVAHLHGGELTSGAFDEAIRHSISKMSHLHFTSTEEYRKRVIQLGEHPSTVFNVGGMGIENIKRLNLLSKDEFEQSINFKLAEVNFLVTFHPATLGNFSPEQQFKELLNALDNYPDAKIIFTKANCDTSGRAINRMIDEYVANNCARAVAFDSLGQLRYLSALQFVSVVIGNSSSGIIEVPSFNIPTINIGDRQKGRVRAESVVDTNCNKSSIIQSIDKSLTDEFVNFVNTVQNPYDPGILQSLSIIETIKKTELESLIQKEFYDLEV